MVRMSWYCGSMPVTRAEAALYALFTRTGTAFDLGADDATSRGFGGDRPRVVEREDDSTARAFAAGLQAGAAAPDDADVLAELEQDFVVAPAKAFAGRRQDDDRDHAPQDPEHRQEAAQLVGAKILEGLK